MGAVNLQKLRLLSLAELNVIGRLIISWCAHLYKVSYYFLDYLLHEVEVLDHKRVGRHGQLLVQACQIL